MDSTRSTSFSYLHTTQTSPHVLLLHGGAWDIPSDLVNAHREGLQVAWTQAMSALQNGIDPLEVVLAAVESMEDDPTFDAGYGSFLNENGEVELDAAIMEGTTLKAGAVAALSAFKRPLRIAKAVLEKTNHVLLVGTGAEAFAQKEGFKKCDVQELVHPREIRAHEAWIAAGRPDASTFFSKPEVESCAGSSPDKRGTVGAVLAFLNPLTQVYELYAGTSTGGTPGKMWGRVGDSPLIGCGTYADNLGAAVSCTGWGEGLIRCAAAKAVSDRVRFGVHPQEAVEQVLVEIHSRTGGRAGLIAVDALGRVGIAYSTPDMACAGHTAPKGLLF